MCGHFCFIKNITLRRYQMSRLVMYSVVLSFVVTYYAALAQTPDEETPAEEVVCDGEVGAAFGLCNAFCEAMDCDSDSPRASEQACDRVAATGAFGGFDDMA